MTKADDTRPKVLAFLSSKGSLFSYMGKVLWEFKIISIHSPLLQKAHALWVFVAMTIKDSKIAPSPKVGYQCLSKPQLGESYPTFHKTGPSHHINNLQSQSFHLIFIFGFLLPKSGSSCRYSHDTSRRPSCEKVTESEPVWSRSSCTCSSLSCISDQIRTVLSI